MKKLVTFFSIIALFGRLAAEDVGLTPEQQEYVNQIIADSKDCQQKSSISTVVAVTQKNYDQEVVASGLPVLVLVSANWCPSCQLFKPIFNEVSGVLKDAFKFVNIDYDSYPEFVAQEQIEGLPMLVLIDKGQVLDMCPGFMTKTDFLNCLNSIAQSLKAENK